MCSASRVERKMPNMTISEQVNDREKTSPVFSGDAFERSHTVDIGI